jgi:hypothetical protein
MKKKNMIIVAHKFHSVCITLSFRFDLPPPVYANRFTSNPLQNTLETLTCIAHSYQTIIRGGIRLETLAMRVSCIDKGI